MISNESEFREWCMVNGGSVQDVEDSVMCTIRGKDTGVGGAPAHVDSGTETVTYNPERDTVTLDFHFEEATELSGHQSFETSARSRVTFPNANVYLRSGGLAVYGPEGDSEAQYMFQRSGENNSRM
jgi:hypothetical protein